MSTKISSLPTADTLTGEELIPLVQGSTTKKVAVGDLLGQAGSIPQLALLTADVTADTTTFTPVAELQCNLLPGWYALQALFLPLTSHVGQELYVDFGGGSASVTFMNAVVFQGDRDGGGTSYWFGQTSDTIGLFDVVPNGVTVTGSILCSSSGTFGPRIMGQAFLGDPKLLQGSFIGLTPPNV